VAHCEKKRGEISLLLKDLADELLENKKLQILRHHNSDILYRQRNFPIFLSSALQARGSTTSQAFKSGLRAWVPVVGRLKLVLKISKEPVFFCGKID